MLDFHSLQLPEFDPRPDDNRAWSVVPSTQPTASDDEHSGGRCRFTIIGSGGPPAWRPGLLSKAQGEDRRPD